MKYYNSRKPNDGKTKLVLINEVENINPRLFYVKKINFYNSDSTNIYDYFSKPSFDSKKISFVDTSSLDKKTINDLKNISYDQNSIVEIIIVFTANLSNCSIGMTERPK